MKLWCALMILAVGGAVECAALSFSYSSPDERELKRLAFGAEMQRSEVGKVPSSWDDFKPPLQGADSAVRVKERYTFLSRSVKIKKGGKKAEIFLISRGPFEDVDVDKRYFLGFWMTVRHLTPPSRYALAELEDGTVSVLMLPEERVQQLFREQRVALPTPDTLPEREWVRERRWAMATRKAGMTGVMLFGAFGAWIIFRRSALCRNWNRKAL